ncbi:MAG: MOSC domain-containing protein [Pyrinomonadaceae bacterium]
MKLSEINIYPIKSCRGISLAEAIVEERGLQFDRRWMMVDGDNRFITQREYPVMATLAVAVDSGQLTVGNGRNSITIAPAEPESRKERVTVFSSRVDAAVYGEEVNGFFSDAIGVKVRLVAMTEAKRAVNYWYRVRNEDHVSFADGYPYLLVGEGSLDELNRRISHAPSGQEKGTGPFHADIHAEAMSIPMNRFRPNFVVKGSEPFAEDTWKRVRIGGTVFHVVKPCARCPIPTIDQSTGVRHSSEPTKTLSTFRQVRRNGKNKILFGQNLIADEAGGTVRVGDEVEVLELR